MKKIQNIISIILVIACICCVFSVPVGAESETYTEGDYTYVISDEKAIITDFNEAITGSITIPSTLGGYPVTDIGMWAFESCTGLTNVTIPEGVTNIGIEAFYWCKNLTNVTIPNSVTSIEYGAFRSCFSLESITIPDNVTEIGNSIFNSCTALTDVNIGNGITSIGNMMFYGCEKITNITIPDNVTSISNGAFFNCNGLKTITIGSNITSIDNNAFYGCANLKDVHYAGTQEQWNSISIGANNNCLTNATIHCIKPYTHTTIKTGTDCKIYQIDYYWVPAGSETAIACYENDVLVHYESKDMSYNSFTVSDKITYDKVKIFVWDGLSNIRPITNGEEVE